MRNKEVFLIKLRIRSFFFDFISVFSIIFTLSLRHLLFVSLFSGRAVFFNFCCRTFIVASFLFCFLITQTYIQEFTHEHIKKKRCGEEEKKTWFDKEFEEKKIVELSESDVNEEKKELG